METYNGHICTPADAIILCEACRIGLLPRVRRRLSEKERQSIKSGSVFVWDECEAGMRRWTDGKSWSASRVSGSFLTYREMEGKRGGSTFEKSAPCESMLKGAEEDSDARPDGYRYKPDGLVKQSFSIKTHDGQHMHLISYYSRCSQTAQHLMQPTDDPQFRHVRPEKGMYPESTAHEPSTVPVVIRGPMGSPDYIHATHQPSMYGRAPYGYAPLHPGVWAPPNPIHTPPPRPHYGPYHHHHHPAYVRPMQYPTRPANGPNRYERLPPHMPGLPPPHYGHVPPPPPPPLSGFPRGYHPEYHGYGSYQPRPVSTRSCSSASPAAPPPSLPARPAPSPVSFPGPKKDDRHDSTITAQAQSTPEMNSKSTVPSTSAGQAIPSTHLMLNACENGQPNVRSSRRSLSGSLPMASDIPMHKLGFEANRDMQALRNLDKTTFKPF